jgi:hypothetical protein
MRAGRIKIIFPDFPSPQKSHFQNFLVSSAPVLKSFIGIAKNNFFCRGMASHAQRLKGTARRAPTVIQPIGKNF